MRTWFGLAAAVVGGLLISAGAVGVTSTWLFVVLGGTAALAGLVNLGQPGAVPLVLAGGWPVAFSLAGLAEAWVLMSGGLFVLAAAFAVVAAGTPEREVGEAT